MDDIKFKLHFSTTMDLSSFLSTQARTDGIMKETPNNLIYMWIFSGPNHGPILWNFSTETNVS